MDDQEAIQQGIEQFVAAYNRGDLEALMSVYADDLVKLRFRSKPEIKRETTARVKDFFASYSGRLTVQTDEIIVAGSVAFARGTFQIVATPRSGGEDLHIVRRFVELWRKDGVGWKVCRTMDAEP